MLKIQNLAGKAMTSSCIILRWTKLRECYNAQMANNFISIYLEFLKHLQVWREKKRMVTINIENRPFQHWVEKCSDLFEDSLKPLFFVSLCAFRRVECQGSLISTIHSLLRCHVKRTIKDTNLWQVPKVLTSGGMSVQNIPRKERTELDFQCSICCSWFVQANFLFTCAIVTAVALSLLNLPNDRNGCISQ